MRLGFIGTGAITSAVVEGLQSTPLNYRIFLSPRNPDIAARLAARYESVEVAATNQTVLDAAEIVFLAVRPQVAHDILASLQFREDHHVVSLIPTLSLQDLQSITAPAHQVTRAIPLPSTAFRQSPTVIYPPDQAVKALFDSLGTAIELDDEKELDAFIAATSTMSSFFGFADTTTSWMERQGIAKQNARAFVGQMLRGLAATTEIERDRSFTQLAKEHQTPGGLNEQVFRAIAPDGKLIELDRALDGILTRLHAGKSKHE